MDPKDYPRDPMFLSFEVVKYIRNCSGQEYTRYTAERYFSNCSEEEYTRYTSVKFFINCSEEEYTEYTTSETRVVLCSYLLR